MNEIIIVDDHRPYVNALAGRLSFYDVEVTKFSEVLIAEAHIKKMRKGALLYLVDMKPMGSVPTNPTEYQKHVLDGPERIFNIVKEQGYDEAFYFMSARFKGHDKEVLIRTNAQKVNKSDLSVGWLENKLEELGIKGIDINEHLYPEDDFE